MAMSARRRYLGAFDAFGSAVKLGYGLRRLRGSYYGSAIRVARSSDNAEIDIGFNIDGSLNTTLLTSFVGSANGKVVIWYDQYSSVANATPVNCVATIVNAGVLVALNGRPSVQIVTTLSNGADPIANPIAGLSIPTSGLTLPASGTRLQAVFLQMASPPAVAGFVNGGAWRITSSTTGDRTHTIWQDGFIYDTLYSNSRNKSTLIGTGITTNLTLLSAVQNVGVNATTLYYINNGASASGTLTTTNTVATPTIAAIGDAFYGNISMSEWVMFNDSASGFTASRTNQLAYFGL